MKEESESTYRENPKCLVRAVANEGDQPDGLELRFTVAPPQQVRDRLKDAGWVFAPAPENRYWFKRDATDADERLVRSIAGDLGAEIVRETPSPRTGGRSNALMAGLSLGAATLARIMLPN